MGALASFNIYIINYWMLIPAVSIIIILSLLEKRKNRRDLCHGRPALLIPFNFLDGFENRTAYAMAFGTATSTVVSLIKSDHTLEFDLPLWATALYVYLQAMVGCLTCFPLFACLTTRYRAVGAILCLLYSLMWLAVKLVQVIGDVEQDVDMDSIQVQYNDTMAVDINRAYIVLQSIPILCCYIVLILYCFYILHRCYITKTYFNKRMQSSIKVHQEEHVRWVLRKFVMTSNSADSVNCSSSETFIKQMDGNIKLRYFTSFPFFRYPARIIAVSFVQLNILYWAGLLLVMTTVSILYPFIYTEITKKYLAQVEVDLLVISSVCSVFALIVCVLNALTQIFVGVRNYRYDMLKIYQGYRQFGSVLNRTPQNILTRSMMFPGYQMAFMLWGILLCFTTVFLLTIAPVLFFYFTAKLEVLGDVVLNLLQVLSFPATVITLFYLQVFMTKRVLLQEKVKLADENPPLNVDNRKFYEIVNYYSLFTNMAVGLFTCLLRIFQSAFLGIFSIARLDRSVFPNSMESWDKGYAAYVSMLLVDNAHNNPCMRVFAHLLWTKILAMRFKRVALHEDYSDVPLLIPDHHPRYSTTGTNVVANDSPVSSGHSAHPWIFVEANDHRSNQARIRWFLIYTLSKNPQLCQLRKQNMVRKHSSMKVASPTEVESFSRSQNEDSVLDSENSCSTFSAEADVEKDNVLINVLDDQPSDSFA
ncbi:hypothetical protein BsWGS_05070 [Bradybaena similaris]